MHCTKFCANKCSETLFKHFKTTNHLLKIKYFDFQCIEYTHFSLTFPNFKIRIFSLLNAIKTSLNGFCKHEFLNYQIVQLIFLNLQILLELTLHKMHVPLKEKKNKDVIFRQNT